MSILLEYIEKAAEKKSKMQAEWLVDIAEHVKYCSWATHVGKFSHPDAKVSLQSKEKNADANGYVCTSNITCSVDIVTPGQYIGTANFLLLELEDGRNVYEHFKENCVELRNDLSSLSVDYEEIRKKMLQVQENTKSDFSDERIKQVYFPVAQDEYHLLSGMTSSGVLFEIKKRLDQMERQARHAKNPKELEYGQNYERIYDLTEIGFGGTKPQNISTLNAKNSGRAYLLASLPPNLLPQDVRPPRKDFFMNVLSKYAFRDAFYALHELLKLQQNNKNIRNQIQEILHKIIDQVLQSVYQIRQLENGWSEAPSCQLSVAQKIWLDDKYFVVRAEKKEWISDISTLFARWIIYTYAFLIKEKKVVLADAELGFMKQEIETVLMEDKEFFI